VQLGPFGTAAISRPIVPASGDYDDGEIGGMTGKGNQSIRRTPAPVPLCPPQTLHAALTRTRAVAVGSQRLTADCLLNRERDLRHTILVLFRECIILLKIHTFTATSFAFVILHLNIF
jgi:hypothetical protein